ncbi:MAG: ABC transporter ATP-binding protein [Asgard group archaeon]|nr:ABC transporter ATP-binding protein [Asgard group archaeon]
MSNKILKCIDVQKQYELRSGPLQVLKGVSFELSEGELLAIVGISGSGKTTLLNLLFGIDEITNGTIMVNGTDINQISREEFRLYRQKNIGMIFQDFYLISSMTAIENVMAPLILAGKSEQLALTKAYRLLERVEMREMANKLPYQLSNGQKQRVAIARAIANDPKLLICDEPTRALDTSLGDEIINLLVGLIKKEKISVLMTTHDPEVAARADRVLIIRDGKLIEEKIKDKTTFDFRAAKEIYRKTTDSEEKIETKEKTTKSNKKPKKKSSKKVDSK